MQQHLLIWFGLVIGYFLAYIAERSRHKMNYSYLVSQGAVDHLPKLMKAYYMFNLAVIPASLAEYLFTLPPFDRKYATLAIGLIFLGLLLRFWAIHSLEWVWTKRLMTIQGFPIYKRGPYQFINHPEYISRVLEGVGFCYFLGSIHTSRLFIVGSLTFIYFITKEENRQISELQKKDPLNLEKDDGDV